MQMHVCNTTITSQGPYLLWLCFSASADWSDARHCKVAHASYYPAQNMFALFYSAKTTLFHFAPRGHCSGGSAHTYRFQHKALSPKIARPCIKYEYLLEVGVKKGKCVNFSRKPMDCICAVVHSTHPVHLTLLLFFMYRNFYWKGMLQLQILFYTMQTLLTAMVWGCAWCKAACLSTWADWQQQQAHSVDALHSVFPFVQLSSVNLGPHVIEEVIKRTNVSTVSLWIDPDSWRH